MADDVHAMQSDAGSQTFAHPPILRKMALFSAAFGAVFAVLVLLLPYAAPDWNNPFLLGPSFLFCVGSVAWSLFILRSSADTFEVTLEGLCWRSSGKPSVFLAWSEVESVQPQNVMQRLVVADGKSRRILVEFHLRGFGDLRRIVLERTAA